MFEQQSKDMVRNLLRTFTERGLISGKQDALAKLKNPDWVKNLGYGHVGRILISDMAAEECCKFFDELEARSMKRLTQGIHEFRSKAFLSQKELFERLAATQSPDVLFVTCSDSRIVPNLITMTEPGELFIIRNAGNIIPPATAGSTGEGATLEFAINLKIRDIIVCGHSNCGAIKAILHPELLQNMPMMADWLEHAVGTRKILEEQYANHSEEERMDVAVQENVLVQLENLRTHPLVAKSLAEGKLNLHGWVYQIHTGDVFVYYPELEQFLPITQQQDDKQGRKGAPSRALTI
jgi:carbonic anhydrase